MDDMEWLDMDSLTSNELDEVGELRWTIAVLRNRNDILQDEIERLKREQWQMVWAFLFFVAVVGAVVYIFGW